MCVYVCVLWCGSSRGELRLERGRGRSEKSQSPSARASNLVAMETYDRIKGSPF